MPIASRLLGSLQVAIGSVVVALGGVVAIGSASRMASDRSAETPRSGAEPRASRWPALVGGVGAVGAGLIVVVMGAVRLNRSGRSAT